MPEAESKKSDMQKMLEDGFKLAQGAVGALLKMSSDLSTSIASSSPTPKVSESPSKNGNGSGVMPNSQEESDDSSSTSQGTESVSLLPKIRSTERRYTLSITVGTFGSVEQMMEEAEIAVKHLKLVGIEVSSYAVKPVIPESESE